ncbi:hypothetical protein Vadar_007290 [Vaccinium darrowii]|uniref:Uncharacterized protein n=1 Tax=Vaccinium darrowii TaxID=229202 RepID=A0ACB7ZAK5_9ERIC|nr:hypothetical protein Vadar_007290 [Vaccinium darrowii]
MSPLPISALLLLLLSLSLLPASHSLTCTSQTFTNNKLYSNCLDLPSLSSYLHYTYTPSNSSLSIAFQATPATSSGWISWAINPTSAGMAGSQALLAFKASNGSMTVQTYNISSYSSIVKGNLSFEVADMEAEYSGGVMTIFATVSLPAKLGTTVNQVWQVGSSVTDGFPDKHAFQAANLNSKGTLDLLKGETTSSGSSGGARQKRKNIHGILNVTSAYAIGVAGWGTGLKLGSESKGVQYTAHRTIGIALFCLATVQVFALFLRPKKDHKYRFYWNIYHHIIGYAILVLGILNVFKGLDILLPEKKWRSAYIIVISVLGGIALLLEAITWVVVLRRKSSKSTKPYDGHNNGRDQPLTS